MKSITDPTRGKLCQADLSVWIFKNDRFVRQPSLKFQHETHSDSACADIMGSLVCELKLELTFFKSCCKR